MKTIVLAALLSMVAGKSMADLLFNVTFDQPLYTNGQPVVGGSSPHEPSTAENTVVSDAIAGFGSQVAVVSADYAGGGMTFNAGPFTAGIHRIQWEMSNVGRSFNGQTDISLSDDTNPDPLLLALSYTYWADDSATIQYWGVPDPYPPPYYFITLNAPNSIDLLLDLDSNFLSLTINDNVLIDQYTLSGSTALNGVSFYQNASQMSVQYAVDNFRWEVVPEPGSLYLLILGGASIYLTQRKRRTNHALNHRLHHYG